jgi:hypothetical protein
VPCARAYSDVSIGRRRLAQVTCGVLRLRKNDFSSATASAGSSNCVLRISLTSGGDKVAVENVCATWVLPYYKHKHSYNYNCDACAEDESLMLEKPFIRKHLSDSPVSCA